MYASKSTIFQTCRDGASASRVLTFTPGSECALVKDTTRYHQLGSNQGPLDSESDTLPVRHRAPWLFEVGIWIKSARPRMTLNACSVLLPLAWHVVYYLIGLV